jgi:hypothetical protein
LRLKREIIARCDSLCVAPLRYTNGDTLDLSQPLLVASAQPPPSTERCGWMASRRLQLRLYSRRGDEFEQGENVPAGPERRCISRARRGRVSLARSPPIPSRSTESSKSSSYPLDLVAPASPVAGALHTGLVAQLECGYERRSRIHPRSGQSPKPSRQAGSRIEASSQLPIPSATQWRTKIR